MPKTSLTSKREKAFERILTDLQKHIHLYAKWCPEYSFMFCQTYAIVKKMSHNLTITLAEKQLIDNDPMLRYEKFLTTHTVSKQTLKLREEGYVLEYASGKRLRLFSQPHPFETDQSLVYPKNRRP